MKEPRVSVIINNYNYGEYLAAAIESALGQTYRSIEVIVVDDGSTDSSRGVIERYAPDVRTVLKENGGQASAFNAGYALAKGELVQFLDADDLLDADCVERVVAAWEDDLSSIQFKLRFINTAGDVIRTGLTMPRALSEKDQLKMMLTRGGYRYSSTTGNMFARRFLDQVLPMPEDEFRICADTYLQTAVPFTGRVKAMRSVHGSYRVHGENAFYTAHRTAHPRHMKTAIESAERRARLITMWAAKMNLKTAPRIGDREINILSLRLIHFRLCPQEHPIKRDSVLNLFAWSFMCLPSSMLSLGVVPTIKTFAKIILALLLPLPMLRIMLKRKE